MRVIAFDVMGSDGGIKPAVEASLVFLKTNKNYKILLVGRREEIKVFLPSQQVLKNLEIVDAHEVVSHDAGVGEARNNNTSMAVALSLVKDGKAHAALSAGSTPAYLASSILILRRLPGVKRPAFMPIFPSIIKGKKFVVLDVGANLEVTAEILVQWAKIGDIFSKTILGIPQPKIGILNVGVEDNKGLESHQEAHQVLKKMTDLSYAGFVEPREPLFGEWDVIVADGYAGNMFLKSLEGTALAMNKLIKQSIKSKLRYIIGALISRGAFKKVKETLDYRNTGAAWVIGLNGLAMKSHGSSDKKAFLGALGQTKLALEDNILDKLREVFKFEGKDES